MLRTGSVQRQNRLQFLQAHLNVQSEILESIETWKYDQLPEHAPHQWLF